MHTIPVAKPNSIPVANPNSIPVATPMQIPISKGIPFIPQRIQHTKSIHRQSRMIRGHGGTRKK